jgi:hypothetical protein
MPLDILEDRGYGGVSDNVNWSNVAVKKTPGVDIGRWTAEYLPTKNEITRVY